MTAHPFDFLTDAFAVPVHEYVLLPCGADILSAVSDYLLQRKGEIVAVTGDGTNDAPALNFANVGLSMGSGTSVAKDASDITLLDDSFTSIASAVMWGRSLYRNIQRFVLFQLTINFAAIIVVFVGSIFGTEMPLTVVQILWVNIIMDTFAALAMASLPPNPAVMNEPPRPKDEFIITPAMARTIFTCGTIFVGVLLGMLFYWRATTGELSLEQLTVFFSVFVFLQFWNMFNAKGFEACHSVLHDLRGSRTFFLVLLLIAVGQVLIVEFGGPVFRTTPLTWVQWLEVIGYTSLIAILGDVVRTGQAVGYRQYIKGGKDAGTDGYKKRVGKHPGKIQYGGIGKQLCIIIQGIGLGKEGGYIGALLRTEACQDYPYDGKYPDKCQNRQNDMDDGIVDETFLFCRMHFCSGHV